MEEEPNSKILEHLIRLPLFKKELKATNKLNQKEKCFLVKKAVTEKIIGHCDLKNIIKFLDNNKILTNEINYNNYDQFYPKISKYLVEKKSDYINLIKQYKIPEDIKLKENERKFAQKELFDHPKLKYFDDFEITF